MNTSTKLPELREEKNKFDNAVQEAIEEAIKIAAVRIMKNKEFMDLKTIKMLIGEAVQEIVELKNL